MKILVATDGSEYSRKAIEKCTYFVAPEGRTEIMIISAVENVTPIAAEPFGVSNQYYAEVAADLRKQAGNAVDDAKQLIAEKCSGRDYTIESEVYTGNVKEEIVEAAKRFGADLIVVGSHGYGFLSRVLLGSVSDFVIHHAPCSVLVVRG
ncbi:MAG: universal stress protein [Acidobacteria bacterium]|nr:universal stress protein [Acidobacteriota bacterium]MBK8151136.1 universal stress protein [Acidobacteriota bacterium]MBK8812866.1 universal stress protein [Acidobacteriota bacterium]